ncbi:hypothetical protein P7K49_029620 [Saguinus oedipus]|uniref:SHC SH2 domain-containing protein n=1 Tax=Saguinus oedipus TaxID=9490 RepID=A0ABQ9U7S3_SAGOE|nr:hypothetical protein P7K49_029620 [Saguinus oedipus]
MKEEEEGENPGEKEKRLLLTDQIPSLKLLYILKDTVIEITEEPNTLTEITDVDFAALKAVVRLAEPYLCDSQVSTFTMECMKELLDLKEHKLLLQELWVVFDSLEVFDQTALAIEHVSIDIMKRNKLMGMDTGNAKKHILKFES